MAITLIIIAICLIFGGVAAFSAQGPITLPDFSKAISRNDFQQFSPQKTLFIIGPSEEHNGCKLQRRLVKPALAALIRDDVSVMEVYGDNTPTKNGEPLEWLDPSLLRHGLDAEDGFLTIYVNENGKTTLRSKAPVPTADLLDRIGLSAANHSSDTKRAGDPKSSGNGRIDNDKSRILKKLQAV